MKDEIDILYAASNRLTQASTAVEQLEAISNYAREQGANSGVLFYIDNDTREQPECLEIVAEWATGDGMLAGIGTRYSINDMPFTQVWMASPNRPTFVSDTTNCDLLDAASRAIYNRFNIRATVILPLNSKGRWVGMVMLTWTMPYLFDEHDQRILTAIIQLAAPVVDSVRLFEQTQRRADELETAKTEIDILYASSNKLTQATTPDEIIEAVSDYARENRATSGMLFYIYYNRNGEPDTCELVAQWNQYVDYNPGAGQILSIRDYPLGGLLNTANHPLFIEDIDNTPVLLPHEHAGFAQFGTRSAAILTLNSKGRWVGKLIYTWDEPRIFNERDQRVYTALIQQAAPVIDSVQLAEQTQRRAVRTERLLEVNTALSQATNEQQILAAVARYADRQDASLLSLNYLKTDDHGLPGELRPMALWKDGQPFVDEKSLQDVYYLSEYPASQLWIAQPERVMLIEDLANDPRLDPRSAQTLSMDGRYSSAAGIPLFNSGRWQGIVFIYWREPHKFSAEERHIYSAMTQTAASVVATRRAYLAEEEAREDNQQLYRASEAINAATTFEEIVQAVAMTDVESHQLALMIFENYNYEGAAHLDMVAGAGEWGPTGERLQLDTLPFLHHVRQQGVLVFEDIAKDSRLDPVSVETLLHCHTQAMIMVWLSLNKRWMGIITSESAVPRRYTEREIRLFGGIGGLVAAAIERIRLQAETEAARQRAEMLARVNAALSQATDEGEILAAVSSLAEHYGVSLSMLSYFDTDEYHQLTAMNPVALRSGTGAALPLSILPIISFGPEDYPVLQNAYSNPQEILYIEDLFTDPRSESGDTRDFSKAVRWQAVILMPLKAGDQWVGMLSFAWDKKQTFTEEMRSVFDEIRPPTMSVIATRRAYLAEEKARRETEMRVHELETVAKVSAAVTTIVDMERLLQTVTDLTKSSFKLDHIHIYLYDEIDRQLILTDSQSRLTNRRINLDDEHSLVAQVGYTRQGIIVDDIVKSQVFTPKPMLPEAHSELAVPMVVGDKLIGVLEVQSREANRFTLPDVRVMTTLADLIAVALENARLYQHAQALATSEERHRLARELHDSVSQALYGIALGARTARIQLDRDPSKVAEPLDYVLSLAEAGLAEMRALIFELRPESLENEGMIAALAKQATSLQVRHSLNVQTEFCDEPPVSADVKEAVYRIAREALHNTVKHARATEVSLRVSMADDGILLEVGDNGVGFDANARFPGHLGLHSMRERAAKLNGSLELDSEPGNGTRIRVFIPTA